jgi:signal peptidase II
MILIIVFIFFLLLDQLSKGYIISHFNICQSVPVLKGVFSFTYVTNKGGAFSILSKFPVLFMILSTLLLILGIIFYKKLITSHVIIQLSSGLILSGALGNLIDRIRFGSVVDFIDFYFWPTFNVADIAISTGACLLIIKLLFIDAKSKGPVKEPDE